MTNPVVFLVGMPGAGKSEAASYFVTKGFKHTRLGQITVDEVAKRGLSLNEANERIVREDLRREHGMAVHAKLAWPLIRNLMTEGPVVVDGLYSWSEYLFLRSLNIPKIYVVAIAARRALRYERLSRRPHRPLSATEAEERDYAEIETLEKGGPIAIADFTVVNDGDVADLQMLLSEISQRL